MTRIDLSQIAICGRYIRTAVLRSSLGLAALVFAALTLVPSPTFAQEQVQAEESSKPTGQRPDVLGYPIDWSNKQVHYRPGISLQEIRKIEKDPRYWHQKAVAEHNAANANVRGQFDLDEFLGHLKDLKDNKKKKKDDPLEVDWAVSLGTAAVAQNMSPAKYSYTGPASCSDWVVFGLNATPSASQATLFAVNNLYGTANGCTANPGVLFSYRTAGPVQTSPVISFFDNGLQVAYVDNETGKATLVVLKYKSGDGTAAGAPVLVPGTGTQVSFQYSTTTNTNSSPYIDFASDTAYVGDDAGKLYKISPVFGGGTPALVWSATLAATTKLTAPILDQLHNVVVVGSNNGTLYARKASDGTAVGTTLTVGSGPVIDPPTLVGGSTTYAFVTDNCNASGDDSVLFEAGVTGSTFTSPATRSLGQIHKNCATNNFHAPTLDDAVYNGSAGFLYACGTVAAGGNPGNGPFAPTLYSYSFNPNTGVLGTNATDSVAPSHALGTDECSPITYFTNNSTAKIFWGMGSATDGTVNSTTVLGTGALPAAAGITQDTLPSGLGGTSGIVIDNASATSTLANIYFSAQAAGNITAPVGGTAGSCLQGFAVTGANPSGTTVTLTGSGFNFIPGGTVVVAGFTGIPAFYNGTFAVVTASATTLTYVDAAATSNTSQNTAGHTASWGTCGFQLTQTGLN